MQFITQKEALEALRRGERVQFHFGNKSIEINRDTTFEELRWGLMEYFTLTSNDVINGKYSIIEERHEEMEKEYGYVVVKMHYTDNSIHEIQCICFDREKANKECERIQKEIDPDFNEWKVVYEALVEIIR